MDNHDLQNLVEKISNEYFGQPFRHQARFNPRLRTTGGRYLLRSHDIEFNPRQYEYHGPEALESIIKHELCHYHLHLAGKGYRHRDRDFKTLLEQVGGSRFCEMIPGTGRSSAKIHTYQCKKCKQVYKRRKKMNTDKYVCGSCRGRLEFIKTQVFSQGSNP